MKSSEQGKRVHLPEPPRRRIIAIAWDFIRKTFETLTPKK